MKILIVDDSSTMRRVLEMGILKVLKDETTTILHASDGKEGLAVSQKNLDIDYIFLDVNMPIMKGDEMLRQLRQNPETKNIKVIMQTTESAIERIEDITKIGISGYLLKPYTVEIIEALMAKIIAREKKATA